MQHKHINEAPHMSKGKSSSLHPTNLRRLMLELLYGKLLVTQPHQEVGHCGRCLCGESDFRVHLPPLSRVFGEMKSARRLRSY